MNAIGNFYKTDEQMIENGNSVQMDCCHFCNNGEQNDIAAKTCDGFESVHDAFIYNLKGKPVAACVILT